MLPIGTEFQVTVKVTDNDPDDDTDAYKLELKHVTDQEPMWVSEADIGKLCPDLRIQILEDQKKAIESEIAELQGEASLELE